MADDRSFNLDVTDKETHAFLQWKGTDACFDFYCKCGADGHFDGYFAHYVKCTKCGALYQMPFVLYPREVTPSDETRHFVVVSNDEDEDDEA